MASEEGKQIRAVFFDIDDTLYSSTDLSQKARRTAVEHMVSKGLEMDPEEAYEALLRVVKRYGSNYGYHLDRFFTDELNCPPDYRMISAAVIAYHHTKFVNMRPYPHTVETVLELRLMGMELGIITDGLPIKQWEKLVRLGLDDFFDTVIISGDEEVGLNKPDPRVFELALEKIGVSAGEAQEKSREMWETAVGSLRRNTEVMVQANSRLLQSWRDMAKILTETSQA